MVVTCPNCGAKNRIADHNNRMQPVCGRCHTPLSNVSTNTESKPVTVTDATFRQLVLNASRPVLLDCWAPWCGPCRMLTPTLEALAAESRGRYTVAKLNVDENPATSQQFNISSIPTMLVFHNGQLVDRLVGLQPKAAIAAKLATFASAA